MQPKNATIFRTSANISSTPEISPEGHLNPPPTTLISSNNKHEKRHRVFENQKHAKESSSPVFWLSSKAKFKAQKPNEYSMPNDYYSDGQSKQ